MHILINNKSGEKILLDQEVFYIGTFENCDLKIDAESDSRIIIKEEFGKYILLRKLGNVRINEEPVLKKILETGDKISIGNNNFVFSEIKQDDNADETEGTALHEFMFIDNEIKKSSDRENEKFIQSLVALNSFARQVSSILELAALLNVIIELAANIIKTERGFIFLYDNNGNSTSVKAAINTDKSMEDFEKVNSILGKKLIDLIRENNSVSIKPIFIKEFPVIKSIIAAPLKIRGTVLGYICLINKSKPEPDFDDKDKYLIESLANQAAIAIHNSILYEKVQTETDIRNNLQRYLPRNIASKVMDSKLNLSFEGELRDCSILFADICNFTSLSERLKPEQIVSMLNHYLTIMTKIIFMYNGSVDKFIGDGIMAVFGVPISTPNHAVEATFAAIEMKKQVEMLRIKFAREFEVDNFNIRIGINTGPSVYGNVGSPQRVDLTVIGDNVNIASRLESQAKPGGILISETTFQKVNKLIRVNELEPVTLKGKDRAVKVYEVIDRISLSEDSENSENTMRMHIRVPVKSFVTINRNNILSHGLIRDVSIGGVSLATVGNFKINDEIELTFKLSNNNTFRNIKGIIKYIEKSRFAVGFNSKTNIIMGVEFTQLPVDKSIELVDFINNEKGLGLKN